MSKLGSTLLCINRGPNSIGLTHIKSTIIIDIQHMEYTFVKSGGSGPEWLFDIDSLTKSMNYEPITAGNQTNGDADIEKNVNAWQVGQEKAYDHEYILIPFMPSNSPLSSSTQSSDDKDADEVPGKGDDGVNKVCGSDDQERTNSSTQDINIVGPSINTASTNINTSSLNINIVSPNDPNMPSLEETGIFDGAYDDEDVGAEVDLNNLETTMNVIQALTDPSWIEAMQEELLQFKLQKVWTLVDLHKVRNKARLVAQGYTQEEGIDYDEGFAPVVRIEAIRLFFAYASFMGFIVYQMDVKSVFLYGTIDEEVYVCQPPGFEDPPFPNKVYKVEKALYGLHQAPRAWYETLSTYLLKNGFKRGNIDKTLFIKNDRCDILLVHVYVDDIIFGSTRKSLCIEFEQMMHKRFQMSSMRELTFFLGLQTPIETNKALIKDEEAEDVDVHLYRSMIGSLMYLTASRPDIMFAVCACARFQVTPKVSHLHAVKKIFRYLKGQPKLGLWYPRDSPFDLKAFSDSDYVGASLDRKSTTGGYQFLGKRLISWQCKKQTIIANSTTEAKYVAAANCCGQVLWIQNQMLDYGYNFMNTKIYVDNESTIYIVKNPVFHSKTKHTEIRHHFIRDSYEKKLIQVIKIHTDHNVADLLTKAFDVSSDEFGVKTGSCKGNADFHQIVDFLNASTIRYSLTISPTIYASYIEQFWAIAKSKIVNNETQIHAKVDGMTIVISKSSVRSNLHFNDEDGVTSPTNSEILENLAEIFDQLSLMGYAITSDKLTFQKGHFSPQWKFMIHTILHCLSPKKTVWEQFSSNIATAIICLATNRTFNFSKLIFDGMVKNLDNQRIFWGGNTLFPTMLAIEQPGQGEGPTIPAGSQHTPLMAPSTETHTSPPQITEPPTSSTIRDTVRHEVEIL
ncbi:putative ribonuclease H-like domain-containing protein [Tanacetum coccineum]